MPDAEPDEQASLPAGEAPRKLSNTERLRAQLASCSLAAALLAVWEDGDPEGAQARMLDAVHSFRFHEPKQDGDEQTPAK